MSDRDLGRVARPSALEAARRGPWIALLSLKPYWLIVVAFSATFGVCFSVLATLFTAVSAAVVVGVLLFGLLVGAGALLRGELDTFWPKR